MHCRQIKSQIDDVLHRRTESLSPEAVSHIQDCPDCRAEYEAVQNVIESLNSEDTALEKSQPPMDRIRARVIARAADSSQQKSATPSIAIGAVTAFAFIAFLMLFPFHHDKTIGYQVAVAGVDRQMIEEDHIICDLLYNIGLREADVDFIGCDQTCRLTVIDLKTIEEAELVIAALNEVGPESITSNVIPVRISTKATLFEKVSKSN